MTLKINQNNYITDIKEIKKQAQLIAKKYKPEKIILFGSYAKGNITCDSDVDLMVIINTQASTWDIGVDISLMLKHTFPMDIIVRTPKEITKRLKYGDFFIKDIMKNGKVLYERNRS